MHVQGLGVADVVRAPDPVDELHPGQHPAHVTQQHLEQLELLEGDLHLLAPDGHHVPVHIHPDRPRLHDRATGLVGLTAAAQHRAHPGDQFPGRERLGDVVIGAEFQADDLVDLAVLGGQHDHRNVGPLAQRPADLAARQTGKHQVQQHEIGAVPVESLDRVRPGRADRYLEALPAQHVGQGIAERLLILDHEHPCHFTASLTGCAEPPAEPLPGAGDLLTTGICRVKVDPTPSWLQTVTLPR